MNRFLRTIAVGACAGHLATTANSAADTREVDDLLDRADALVRMGMAEKGASRSFEEALALLDTATERLAAADISAAARRVHSLMVVAHVMGFGSAIDTVMRTWAETPSADTDVTPTPGLTFSTTPGELGCVQSRFARSEKGTFLEPQIVGHCLRP